MPAVGSVFSYCRSRLFVLRLFNKSARRSAARAAFKSSRKNTSASASSRAEQQCVATPCWMPGEKPWMAKIVSLVRPSGAYSEIFRLPCRFSIQTLSNDASRCFRITTKDGSADPGMVGDEADDALAGPLGDPPLRHAEEADVEVVEVELLDAPVCDLVLPCTARPAPAPPPG